MLITALMNEEKTWEKSKRSIISMIQQRKHKRLSQQEEFGEKKQQLNAYQGTFNNVSNLHIKGFD